MSEAPRKQHFELLPFRDDSGESWLLVRADRKQRVIQQFRDRAVGETVMKAMEALEQEPGHEPTSF
jgi:hypothetical protein